MAYISLNTIYIMSSFWCTMESCTQKHKDLDVFFFFVRKQLRSTLHNLLKPFSIHQAGLSYSYRMFCVDSESERESDAPFYLVVVALLCRQFQTTGHFQSLYNVSCISSAVMCAFLPVAWYKPHICAITALRNVHKNEYTYRFHSF